MFPPSDLWSGWARGHAKKTFGKDSELAEHSLNKTTSALLQSVPCGLLERISLLFLAHPTDLVIDITGWPV